MPKLPKALRKEKKDRALNVKNIKFERDPVLKKGIFTRESEEYKVKQKRAFQIIEATERPVLVYGHTIGSDGDICNCCPKYIYPISQDSRVIYSRNNPAALVFCAGPGYLTLKFECGSISESEQWKEQIEGIVERFTNTTGLHAKYSIGKILGQGAFGKVFLCTAKDSVGSSDSAGVQPGQECAVKRMKKQGMTKEDIQLVHKEVAILKKINHPNIYKHYEFFQDRDYLYMVLELIGGEELFDRLTKIHHFGEKKVKEVMKTLCACLEHLDKVGVLHRDLKPQNIMMTSMKPDAAIKLIDFGLGSIEPTSTELVGSPAFLAPEMAVGGLPDSSGNITGIIDKPYTSKVDVWSLGVIHYMLMSGSLPFTADNATAVFKVIVKGEYNFDAEEWKDVSSEAKEFIQCMLTVDQEERYSAKQLLRHKWFSAETKNVHLAGAAKKIKLIQAKRQLSVALKAARAMLAIKLPSTPSDASKSKSLVQELVKQNSKLVSGRSKKLDKSIAALKVEVELTEDEKENLKQVFQMYDGNGNGSIDADELLEVFLSLGKQATREEVEKIIDEIDEDDSKTLDLDEFVKFMGAEIKKTTETHNEAVDMFNSLDPEGTGQITMDDFRKLTKPLLDRTMDDETFEEMLKSLDANGDNTLDLYEFEELFNTE